MNMQCLQLGEVRSVHDVNSVYLYYIISMYMDLYRHKACMSIGHYDNVCAWIELDAHSVKHSRRRGINPN